MAMIEQKQLSPRHYAAQILQEQDREKRIMLLDSVPEQWRSLVKCHVKNGWGRREK